MAIFYHCLLLEIILKQGWMAIEICCVGLKDQLRDTLVR